MPGTARVFTPGSTTDNNGPRHRHKAPGGLPGASHSSSNIDRPDSGRGDCHGKSLHLFSTSRLPDFRLLRIASNKTTSDSCFVTNAQAPASEARFRVSLSSYRLNMTTLQSHDAQMTRVASMPSIFGIATSMTTTSGTSRVACATASSPSTASPRTSRSVSRPSRNFRPIRAAAWSSTNNILIIRALIPRVPGHRFVFFSNRP